MAKKTIPTAEDPTDGVKSKRLATAEGEGFSSGDLEKDAERRAHDRREDFRDGASHAAKIIFWLLVVSAAAILGTEMWHLLAPESWHYLNAAQKEKVETILFSGALAAMASEYSKKYM